MKSRTGRKTMSNALARFAVQNVERQGLALSTFLKYTGLTADDLKAPGERPPEHKRAQIPKHGDAALPSDQPAAIRLRALIEVFPDLIALVINCRNLEVAIRALLDCKDNLGELDQIRFTRTTRGFVIDFVDESGSETALSAFAIFMMLASVIRHYLPATQFSLAIELRRPPMPGGTLIDPLIRPCIAYNMPRNRLTCVTNSLTLAHSAYNDLLHSYVKQKLDEQLAHLAENRSFTRLVEKFLRDTIVSNSATQDSDNLLAQVCRLFGMSRWTVLRNLKRDGESYKGLYAKVRYAEACRLLLQTDHELREISRRLGFASQSSFSRFFKSIYGQPPLRFREQERG